MGIHVTELSELTNISRPTIYKFIDMYERGEKDRINKDILKLLDYIEREPRMSKRNAIYYVMVLHGDREPECGCDDCECGDDCECFRCNCSHCHCGNDCGCACGCSS